MLIIYINVIPYLTLLIGGIHAMASMWRSVDDLRIHLSLPVGPRNQVQAAMTSQQVPELVLTAWMSHQPNMMLLPPLIRSAPHHTFGEDIKCKLSATQVNKRCPSSPTLPTDLHLQVWLPPGKEKDLFMLRFQIGRSSGWLTKVLISKPSRSVMAHRVGLWNHQGTFSE